MKIVISTGEEQYIFDCQDRENIVSEGEYPAAPVKIWEQLETALGKDTLHSINCSVTDKGMQLYIDDQNVYERLVKHFGEDKGKERVSEQTNNLYHGTKTLAWKAVVEATEFNQLYNYQNKTGELELFAQSRVEVFADNHGSSCASGNTFSGLGENTFALNVSLIDYVYSYRGERIGIRMATSEAYGHVGPGEREQVAGRLLKACRTFTKAAQLTRGNIKKKELPELFQLAGKNARHDPKSKKRQTTNLSSLTGAMIVPSSNEQFKALLGNVGNGMLVVIDSKTKKVKHALTGRTFPVTHTTGDNSPSVEIGNVFRPWAIRNLDKRALSRGAVDVQEVNDINEDDIIIHMTENAAEKFSGLKRQLLVGNVECETVYVWEYQLESLIKEAFKNDELIPAVNIADKILHQVVRDDLVTAPAVLQNLADTLTNGDYLPQESELVAAWIKRIEEKDVNLAERVSNLPNITDKQTKYIYKSAAEFFQREIVDRLQKITGGEVAVSVMYVPNKKVELVRALIECPQNAAYFLSKILDLSKEDIQFAFSRLENEVHIVRPDPNLLPDEAVKGRRLNEVEENKQRVYSDEQLQNARQLIGEYLGIIDKASQAPDKKQAQANYRRLSSEAKDISKKISIFHNALLHENVVNKHRHGIFDWIFGIENTRSWRETRRALRTEAAIALFDEVKRQPKKQEQLKLLEWGADQALLNEVVSNYTFFKKPKTLRRIEKSIGTLKQEIALDEAALGSKRTL